MDKKLDDICRKIVHARDYGKPCIICGTGFMNEHSVVCHHFKRRHIATRWDLMNINLGHAECNVDEENNLSLQTSHRFNLCNKIGLEMYYELFNLKGHVTKMSISEKQGLYNKLKNI